MAVVVLWVHARSRPGVSSRGYKTCASSSQMLTVTRSLVEKLNYGAVRAVLYNHAYCNLSCTEFCSSYNLLWSITSLHIEYCWFQHQGFVLQIAKLMNLCGPWSPVDSYRDDSRHVRAGINSRYTRSNKLFDESNVEVLVDRFLAAYYDWHAGSEPPWDCNPSLQLVSACRARKTTPSSTCWCNSIPQAQS